MKRLISMIILAVMALSAAASAEEITEEAVLSRILAMKDEYYEGRPWTNDDTYAMQGGGRYGAGCMAFAYILSDAAFGSLPAEDIETIDYDALRAGDILRLENNSHAVVILEKYDDHVIVAEGNYNRSIHWGRSLTKQQVLAADYCITRYPDAVTVKPEIKENLPERVTPGGIFPLSLMTYKDLDFVRWELRYDPRYFSHTLDLRYSDEILSSVSAEATVTDTLQLVGEVPNGWYGQFVIAVDPKTPEGTYDIYMDIICDANGRCCYSEHQPVIVGRTPGDADESGDVDIYDVKAILWQIKYRKYTDTDLVNMANADVNADGKADLADAALVFQYLCGWDVELR